MESEEIKKVKIKKDVLDEDFRKKVLEVIEGAYFWIFPYIGGILICIAFITPAGNTILSLEFVWIWGFVIMRNGAFTYMTDLFRFLTSLACSAFILFGALLLIKTSINVKNGKKELKDYKERWLFISILILIITIIWMIMMELSSLWYISYDLGYFYTVRSYHFWGFNYYNLNFGIYGIFIAVIITVIGLSITQKDD